jgi:hypothetical protein
LVISPVLLPRCRFLPTCSDYALEALAEHGAARGSLLAGRRLLRCHPWGGSGYDPVPPAPRRGSHVGAGCRASHVHGEPASYSPPPSHAA